MKKYFTGLLTGVLAMGLALSALAITGRMTIEVDPINIQVNGQTFAPTDVNGAEVPVFAYNGTTYAPLRALAEAYGLEVGYDAAANMATVQAPDAQPAADQQTGNAQSKPGLVQNTEDNSFDYSYEEFKGLWEEGESVGGFGRIFWANDDEETLLWIDGAPEQLLGEYATRLATEVSSKQHNDFALRNGKRAGQIVYTVDLSDI